MEDTYTLHSLLIIFTRHKLTGEQWEKIYDSFEDYESVTYIDMSQQAALSLVHESDAEELWRTIFHICLDFEWCYIYGVIPVPIREQIVEHDPGNLFTFEAWNVNRAEEGTQPRFEFKRWAMTYLSRN